MDDEKYFTFANSCDVTNQGYYTTDKSTTPDNIKFISKSKFEPKVLAWCAISAKGISAFFVQTQSGIAVNADIYITKCLPKMVDFVKKNHKDDKNIFWPDLASCHYAKNTLDWLASQNIPFVPKYANPSNIPQARPIENLWSISSQLLYENGWEAITANQLENRIKYNAKKLMSTCSSV